MAKDKELDGSRPGTRNTDLSDLEWTAFCYLCDELSPAERHQFESLMATDTAACEALQLMVGVVDAISITAPLELKPDAVCEPATGYLSHGQEDSVRFETRVRHSRKWIAWASSSAAVAVLLLGSLIYWLNANPGMQPDEVAAGSWSEQLDIAEEFISQMAVAEDADSSDDEQFPESTSEEVDDEWLYDALVSLDEWPDDGSGGG